MSKGGLISRAAILSGLLGVGCGDPCNDLNCDNCDTLILENACLLKVAVDDSEDCQQFKDDVSTCR